MITGIYFYHRNIFDLTHCNYCLGGKKVINWPFNGISHFFKHQQLIITNNIFTLDWLIWILQDRHRLLESKKTGNSYMKWICICSTKKIEYCSNFGQKLQHNKKWHVVEISSTIYFIKINSLHQLIVNIIIYYTCIQCFNVPNLSKLSNNVWLHFSLYLKLNVVYSVILDALLCSSLKLLIYQQTHMEEGDTLNPLQQGYILKWKLWQSIS